MLRFTRTMNGWEVSATPKVGQTNVTIGYISVDQGFFLTSHIKDFVTLTVSDLHALTRKVAEEQGVIMPCGKAGE
jgi:hypothetical protein